MATGGNAVRTQSGPLTTEPQARPHAATSTGRMVAGPETDAEAGRVVWTTGRSLWTIGHAAVAVIGGPLLASPDAILLFIGTTAVTLCAGHSVGMHRLLIHRSFAAPKWLEYLLVYLGTLVGMAGPVGMIFAHDQRDWAQRQARCHDLFAHRRSLLGDAWWQMHCAVVLDRPPRFVPERAVAADPVYRWLERTWMAQQLPWAVLFFMIGGWSWVVWGICARVTVSLIGHWYIGHLAHRHGEITWQSDSFSVQGRNVRYAGLITFGECWHSNHHAFSHSARIGLAPGETDPGWWLILAFRWLGLAWDIRVAEPDTTPGVRRAAVDASAGPGGQAVAAGAGSPGGTNGSGRSPGMVST